MKRIVPYIKKTTSANTQYNKTTSTDTNWILQQAKRLADVANECEKHGLKEGAALNHSNPKMPRMSTGGKNTPKTMCEGVIDNFNHGQYDLSDKQMTGIQEAFRIGNEIIEDFDEVEFEEVTSLPKLKSPLPSLPDMTTLGDLFDIESIQVTYKKKC